MNTLDRLKELSAIREGAHPVFDVLSDEVFDEIFDALPKLLAVVEAVYRLSQTHFHILEIPCEPGFMDLQDSLKALES